MRSIEDIVKKLDNYFELSEDDALELYDELDTLYNELRSKYLTALLNPGENRELANSILDLTKKLLVKNEKNLEEDLLLIALLDILATDIHDRFIGLITTKTRSKRE